MTGQLVDGNRFPATPQTGHHADLIQEYAYQALDDRKTYQDMWQRYSIAGADPVMNTMPMPDADESGRYIDEWGHPVDDIMCGETIDHDEVITYDGPDGIGWRCRRCDAEGFEEREEG